MIPPETADPQVPPSSYPTGKAKWEFGAGAPTVGDDSTQGFNKGSIWIKTGSPLEMFTCTDPTEGAAVWEGIATDDAVDDAIGGLTAEIGNVQTAVTDHEDRIVILEAA